MSGMLSISMWQMWTDESRSLAGVGLCFMVEIQQEVECKCMHMRLCLRVYIVKGVSVAWSVYSGGT